MANTKKELVIVYGNSGTPMAYEAYLVREEKTNYDCTSFTAIRDHFGGEYGPESYRNFGLDFENSKLWIEQNNPWDTYIGEYTLKEWELIDGSWKLTLENPLPNNKIADKITEIIADFEAGN